MAFKFENLEVWNEALNISDQVNKLARTFPKHELFLLSSQIRRAADSAVLNIAEGSQGQTDREFARFLSMSIRSSIEGVSCLYIANRRGYINTVKECEIYKSSETLIKRTQTLKNKLRLKSAVTLWAILPWSMGYGLWSHFI